MNDNIKTEIRALSENRPFAYLASVNAKGHPQIKAMLVSEHNSLKEHYLNTSSKRVDQFIKNPKASVYYCHD